MGTFTSLYSTCGTTVFSCTYSGGSVPCDATVFTVSTTTGNVQIYTTDGVNKAATYSLKITGTLGALTASTVITVTITAGCPSTVITPVAISSISYDISQGSSVTIATLSWTQTLSASCSAIAYSLIDTDTGTTADTAVFTLTGANVVSVSTADSGKVKLYHLKVVGTVSTVTPNEAFTVDVTNNCPSSVITSVAIPGKSYTTSASNLTFNFVDWTDSYSYCTPFTYTSHY